MSVQVAMMAGMAAMSAYSAVRQGQAQGQALDAQAASSRLGAMSSDVEQAEVQAQAANEEMRRREGLLKLMSANRGDISGRGISGEQGSSYDVIENYNQAQNDRDVYNIRFMGESRSRRLSFAREAQYAQASQYMNMAGMARTSGWINAGMSLAKIGVSYFGMPKFGGGGDLKGGLTSTQVGGPDGYGGLG